MAGTFQRRFRVLLGAAAAAVAGWFWLPGTVIDRLAFTAVARSFANPPLFITGHGSHASPWNLRTFAMGNPPDPRQAPVIVALGDDRDGFFQSSPPSPIDLAVILANFQRLGARQAATAVVMAWDAPDPIGLAALDQALARFDSLVMAAPLSRGAVAEAMPPAFRKASVPVASVAGDPSALPVVNRIPLPGVILGNDHTVAGFQSLAAETDRTSAPLLARWEDRVVFAFPLLCVLQRLDLPVTDVEIRPGAWLKLGPQGPILPIDRFGRLALPRKPVAPRTVIPAEALIDGLDGLLPHTAPPPVVLRDDRSAAEPATRAFSKQLPSLIAALASSNSMAPAHDYPRPQASRELALLLLVVLTLAACGTLPAFARRIGFLAIAGTCLAAQFLAAGCADLWLPGLPALAAVSCAWLLSAIVALTPAPPKPALPPPPIYPPQPAAQPLPKPKRKAAPKTAAPLPEPEPTPALPPKPKRKATPKTAAPLPEPEPSPESSPKPRRKAAPKTKPPAAPEAAPPASPKPARKSPRKTLPPVTQPPTAEPPPDL